MTPVLWGAPWGSSGSFRVSGFIGKCPMGSLGSMGLLWCALLVAVFFQGRWVHWVAHRGSSGAFGVARFIEVRPGGRRVRLELIGEHAGAR